MRLRISANVTSRPFAENSFSDCRNAPRRWKVAQLVRATTVVGQVLTDTRCGSQPLEYASSGLGAKREDPLEKFQVGFVQRREGASSPLTTDEPLRRSEHVVVRQGKENEIILTLTFLALTKF